MKCWFSLVFLVLASSTFAQHLVTGRVLDAETNEELIGAHVYLMKNWRKGATTDINGRFSLELDKNDLTDSLIVSYVGFQEVMMPISEEMSISMTPIETVGETVIVTARPLIAEEFKYMEIKKIEIYTNPAAKADPLLAVNSLPSSTTTDESANISLRGSSPIETGVYLNNVPIYDGIRYSQLNGIGTFSIFNPSIIKEVVVFPGNPPLEFGNATSGIISMETDDQILRSSTNSLVLSLANVGFSREQKINESQSFKMFTNWQLSKPMKQLNKEALENIASFSANDLGLYWYGSRGGYQWKVVNYSVLEGYEFNFEHPSFQGIFDQNKKRSFLISNLERPIGRATLSINNGLSYSVGDYSYSNVAFRVKKSDVFAGINYLLNREKWNLKTGISYDQRQSSVFGNYHLFSYALGPNHPTEQLDETANVKVLEAFGYFKYYFSEKLAFGTGLRKNIPMDGAKHYLSNQANLSYTDTEWTIILGVGQYHKHGLIENTGEEFKSMNSQKSLDIKRTKDGLEVALSFFDKAGELNGSKYTSRGVEFFSNYRVSSKLRLSGSLTFLDAESRSNENYTYDLSYFLRGNISYTPGAMWTIESVWVNRQGSTYSPVASANFDSALNVYNPVYTDFESRLPDYSNLSVSVSKLLPISEKLNMIVFASLNNVFDRQNIRDYTYNFDYSERRENLFSRRTGYFGLVVNF